MIDPLFLDLEARTIGRLFCNIVSLLELIKVAWWCCWRRVTWWCDRKGDTVKIQSCCK
jgi:hypothetical protein